MAPTRPSRQQLQLSTSNSDAVNWAEFSNSQIQFDEDMFYPPFRHRSLPSPPSHCHHPSYDPKWNCPSCASCHPLMRMSPSGTSCSHGYSVVYETIDDDDDDTTVSGTLPNRMPNFYCNGHLQDREGSAINLPSSNFFPSRSPRDSTTPPNDLSRSSDTREAETRFNGDDAIKWPKYFELEQNYDRACVKSNAGMKSFQSPSHESWGFHPIPTHGTFGKTIPPTQLECNQLCATCVPNIVSKSPIVNIPGQNGCLPHGKMLNISPYQQTIMCVSNTDNIPKLCNVSSVPKRNIVENNCSPPQETESHFEEPYVTENRYFLNQGCEFSQKTSTDKPQPSNQTSMRKRFSKEDKQSHNTMCQNGRVNGDVDCHEASLHWCPTCQQVPLLDQYLTNRNSAYERSEANADNSTSIGLWKSDDPTQRFEGNGNSHFEQCLAGRHCERKCETDGTSSSEPGRGNDFESSSQIPLDMIHITRLSGSPNGTQRDEDAPALDESNRDREERQRVLALHSMYFKKTPQA